MSENILRNAAAGEDPNLPNVLLCAFTAKAANLIGELSLQINYRLEEQHYDLPFFRWHYIPQCIAS